MVRGYNGPAVGNSAAAPRSAFRVGEWTLHPDACRLSRAGEDRYLRPKLVELLALLASHPHEVLTKDRILDQVWQTRFVSESVLTRNVAELRDRLGDDARPPRYIETIPRRGYRLVADVSRLRAFAQPTLAVLPFENLTRDPEEEYFADGVTDALITELARISGLRVISRQSVLRYKASRASMGDIARELGVDAVVEGAALRAGSRVRVTVQLIQTEPERHLWADTFECELSDVIGLQARIAKTAAESVQGVLTPDDRSRLQRETRIDADAHLAYMKARHLLWTWNPQSVSRALEYIAVALQKAPAFGPAYGVLADCLVTLGFWGFVPPREAYTQAKHAALQALAFDPEHAESRAALGTTIWQLEWDLDGAERELRRAVTQGPSSEIARLSLAMFLVVVRAAREEAEPHVREALALDPLSMATNFGVAWFRLFTGEYGAAIEQARRTLEMHPHALHAQYVIGWASLALGRPGEAASAFELAAAVTRDPLSLAYLAVARGRQGLADAAAQIVDEMEGRRGSELVPAFALALASAAAGRTDAAFSWLDRCLDERDSRLFWLRIRPFFDELRGDARFDELLSRVNHAAGGELP
jgi:TolB-like protein